MPIFYDNPKEVGADRIVNAVAAYGEIQDGTHRGRFRHGNDLRLRIEEGRIHGGRITPGIVISSDALFDKASGRPASS